VISTPLLCKMKNTKPVRNVSKSLCSCHTISLSCISMGQIWNWHLQKLVFFRNISIIWNRSFAKNKSFSGSHCCPTNRSQTIVFAILFPPPSGPGGSGWAGVFCFAFPKTIWVVFWKQKAHQRRQEGEPGAFAHVKRKTGVVSWTTETPEEPGGWASSFCACQNTWGRFQKTNNYVFCISEKQSLAAPLCPCRGCFVN
jgi:hypothetical protein